MKQWELVLEAGRARRHYWGDLWRYRDLFFFLAWRDILVRYKQTIIGVLWAVLRPFLAMVIFTLVFGYIAGFRHETTAPYALVVYAAMLPWQFFASSLGDCSNSLVTNANMIAKVYFPRLIVPASSVVVCFVDSLISFGILLGLMAWFEYLPTMRMLVLPAFILLAMGAALGAGLWMAALNVRYRDFRILVPFIIQLGSYVSPVGFTTDKVAERISSGGYSEWWLFFYSLNPMVGVIDGFRWAILGNAQLQPIPLAFSVVLVGGLLASGLAYFRRTERTFADVI